MTGRRLDLELVGRGLARSRSQAQILLRADQVRVDGIPVRRPATLVEESQTISVEATQAAPEDEAGWIGRGWVGRGAVKLDRALTLWGPEGLSVEGRRCLDVGASTGGFTQVLLERGAAAVTALDVGHGQLDPVLLGDDRVDDREGVSVRDVSPEELGGPFPVLVADLSFISLDLVLPDLARLVAEPADLVLLVKPQFEVGREALGSTGVVRSVEQRYAVLERLDARARELGLSPVDVARSPVTGGAGNVEYLWWLRRCRTGMMDCGRDPAQLAARRGELRKEET